MALVKGFCIFKSGFELVRGGITSTAVPGMRRSVYGNRLIAASQSLYSRQSRHSHSMNAGMIHVTVSPNIVGVFVMKSVKAKLKEH
ncbi:hypothetical protein VTI28DRAFT_6764 [Corynascus sepedonium]